MAILCAGGVFGGQGGSYRWQQLGPAHATEAHVVYNGPNGTEPPYLAGELTNDMAGRWQEPMEGTGSEQQ